MAGAYERPISRPLLSDDELDDVVRRLRAQDAGVSLTHDLAVIQVMADGYTVCQCTCGAISGQKNKAARWTVTPNGDGTAAVSPSIDWPGHFHLTFDRAPLGKVDVAKYEASPAWAVDHPAG